MTLPATMRQDRATRQHGADVDAGAMGDGAYQDVTLLDLVDRLLDRGVVLSGDIVLSVAGIDLVYLSVRALLASAETAMAHGIGAGGTLR